MQLPHYLVMLAEAEHGLAAAYRAIATGHAEAAEVAFAASSFARDAERHAAGLETVTEDRYPRRGDEPERLRPPAFTAIRSGGIGLLRDLAELHQLVAFVEAGWELVGQAAHGVRDRALIDLASGCGAELGVQLAWIRTRMRAEAAQALLVAS